MTLKEYIQERILPLYAAFDPAHRLDHVMSVIESALQMSSYYDVDKDMILAAAACHDIGLCEDRMTHHLVSGRMIRENQDLRQWFTAEQIETIAQAAEDHRASSDHEPRSIYGKIVAEADRQIDSRTVIRRTIQFGRKHYPDLDKEGNWQRTLEHLHEKYADGGYLKLWIPESPNAARLEELRAIIRDEKRLRKLFDEIYSAKLAIFDLDGTLIDTIADLGAAVNYALSLRNLPQHGLDDYRLMLGNGVRNLISRALQTSTGQKPDDALTDACLADFKAYYMEHIDVFSRAYPGVKEIVERLSAEGWMLAVASNKFQAGTEQLIKSIFPDIPWVAVLGHREGRALKPDPAIVDEILDIARIHAGTTLDKVFFIGDSETDIKTAQNAGLPAVAVTWGFRTRDELSEAGAVNFADIPLQMYNQLTICHAFAERNGI